jgi:hypothetical protein
MDNAPYLRANGLTFLPAPNGKPNFKALFHAACAPQRRKLMALRQPGTLERLVMGQKVRRHLAVAHRANPGTNIVVSTELLSLLREPEEIERLRSLFPAGCSIAVTVCLRDKKEFLDSMKRQMAAQKIAASPVQGRSDYVNDDSWLIDYDALLAVFRRLTADLRIIDYDEAVRDFKNIILPFLKALDVRQLPAAETLPFLNKRRLGG